MSDYISEFTGPEIDERLKKAETAYNQASEHATQLADHETRITNNYHSTLAIGAVATANQESIKTLQEVDETNALHFTALDQSVAALESSVSGKLNRYRKWMEGSISVDIGSATLIEISGVSTVGIAHRHYLKLVRIGTETAVLEESKGAGTGVSYTYSIEDNILTVTNTGSYGHNITVIY